MRRLFRLGGRREIAGDLDDELRFHLESRVEDLIRSGLSLCHKNLYRLIHIYIAPDVAGRKCFRAGIRSRARPLEADSSNLPVVRPVPSETNAQAAVDGGAGSPTSSRSVPRIRVRCRDTCIWLIPSSSPISRWVQPSKNRRRIKWRSRCLRPSSSGARMT